MSPKINVYLPDDLAAEVQVGRRSRSRPSASRRWPTRWRSSTPDVDSVARSASRGRPLAQLHQARVRRARRRREGRPRRPGRRPTTVDLVAALVESGGLAVVVLESADLDPDDLLDELRARQARGGKAGTLEAPPSVLSSRPGGAGHTYVGTEHLLLGLDRRPDPRAGPGDPEGHGADPRASAAWRGDGPVGVHLRARDAHVQRALGADSSGPRGHPHRDWCGSNRRAPDRSADRDQELPVRHRDPAVGVGSPSRARPAPRPRAPAASRVAVAEQLLGERRARDPLGPHPAPPRHGSQGSRSTTCWTIAVDVRRDRPRAPRPAGGGRRPARRRSPGPPPGRARATGRGPAAGDTTRTPRSRCRAPPPLPRGGSPAPSRAGRRPGPRRAAAPGGRAPRRSRRRPGRAPARRATRTSAFVDRPGARARPGSASAASSVASTATTSRDQAREVGGDRAGTRADVEQAVGRPQPRQQVRRAVRGRAGAVRPAARSRRDRGCRSSRSQPSSRTLGVRAPGPGPGA